jgi:mono/diheme cytochrome c family protein
MRRELGSVLAIAFVAAVATAACGQKNQAANAGTETTGAENAPAASTPAAATTTAAGAVAEGQVTIPPNLPQGVTAEMIQEGEKIFHGPGNCYTCHGADAKGTALAPDLTSSTHIWVSDYPSYVKLVTDGVPQPKQHPAPMPPKGGSTITAEQVQQVAAYEWSLSHPQGGQ